MEDWGLWQVPYHDEIMCEGMDGALWGIPYSVAVAMGISNSDRVHEDEPGALLADSEEETT